MNRVIWDKGFRAKAMTIKRRLLLSILWLIAFPFGFGFLHYAHDSGAMTFAFWPTMIMTGGFSLLLLAIIWAGEGD